MACMWLARVLLKLETGWVHLSIVETKNTIESHRPSHRQKRPRKTINQKAIVLLKLETGWVYLLSVKTKNTIESHRPSHRRKRPRKTINQNATNTSFIYGLYVIGNRSIKRRNKDYHWEPSSELLTIDYSSTPHWLLFYPAIVPLSNYIHIIYVHLYILYYLRGVLNRRLERRRDLRVRVKWSRRK